MHKKTRLKFQAFLKLSTQTMWDRCDVFKRWSYVDIEKLAKEFKMSEQEVVKILRSGKSKKLTINKTGVKK